MSTWGPIAGWCAPLNNRGQFSTYLDTVSTLDRPTLQHKGLGWQVLYIEGRQSHNPTYRITQCQHEAHPVYVNSSLEAQHAGWANPIETHYYTWICTVFLCQFWVVWKASTEYVVNYANLAYLYITICYCASIYCMHYFWKKAYWKKTLMTAYNTNTQF